MSIFTNFRNDTESFLGQVGTSFGQEAAGIAEQALVVELNNVLVAFANKYAAPVVAPAPAAPIAPVSK